MKKTLVTSLFTILACASLSLALTSCENFLKGSSVKDDLEKKIYIANHDCPVATIEEPPFVDGGVEKNRAIVISFTMAMDPETFTGNYSIKDSEGNSLLEYYMAPQWSNDNTRVTIYADELNLIPLPANERMDIYFTLSRDCETKDGLPIDKAINYKFRINGTKDEIPPVLDSNFSIKRPEKNYSMGGTNIKLCDTVTLTPVTLLEDNLTAENEQIICTYNHINSELELYVQGSDFGGGKVKANITYSRIYDIDGNGKIENPVEKVYKEDLTQTDSDGNMSQTFKFDLNGYDGIYKLVIRTEDSDGNLSEESQVYYVLRDTQMSKSNNALIWFEAPMFRVGGTNPVTSDWLIDGERNYPAPYDSRVPTPQTVDEVRQRVQFQYLEDDTYFVSPLTGKKHYTDERKTFKYLFSWGTSLNNMTSPVEAASIIEETTLHYYGYDDYTKFPDLRNCTTIPDLVAVKNESGNIIMESVYVDKKDEWGNVLCNDPDYPGLREKVQQNQPKAYTYESWEKAFLYNTYYSSEKVDDVRAMEKVIYNLPQAYLDYVDKNKTSNIFLQATIIDSVGNTNTITTLSPGLVDYYGYTVEEIKDQEQVVVAKRITVNYSDLTSDITNLVNIPDKDCQINYRIFYAKKGTEDTALIRNTAAKFNDDPWSGLTDLPWFDVDADETSKYVVYIQPNYTTHSTFTGEWTGQTFGPYLKIEVDPSKTSSAPEAPEIEAPVCDSSVKNSGLLKITLKVNNPAEGVDYVPLYSVDEKGTWQYPEYEYKKEGAKGVITFTMKNPLSAPLKQGDPGNGDPNTKHWKDKDDQGNYIFRENFFDSLERIKEYKAANNGVYENDIYFKVQAVNANGITVPEDSAAKKVTLKSNKDDNIPPYQNSSVETHHSELTADGKYYRFGDVIREDEAHLNKEFTYYYTTYNESWGDRLDVLTEEQIKALPNKGISYVESWCEMKYHWDLEWNGVAHPGETEKMLFIWNCPVVPIDSLDDGTYMFFGEFSDCYGNSCVITLGKGHVGTINKKPQVSVEYKNLFIDNPQKEENIPDDVTSWIDRRTDFTANDKAREKNYSEWMYTIRKDDTITVSIDTDSSDTMYVNFQHYEPYDDTWYESWFKDNPNDADNTNLFTIENGTRTFTDVRNKGFNQGQFYRITVQSYKNDYSSMYDTVTDETLSIPKYYYFEDNWIDEPVWDYTNNVAIAPQTITRHFEGINVRSSFSPSEATVFADKKFIVNVIASTQNYGNNSDMWELHGRLIKTHFYDPDNKGSEYDPLTNTFSFAKALMDLYKSDVHGFVYYVVVVHYADNTTDISDVKQANCN